MTMNIEINLDRETGTYDIMLNDEIIMECLSKQDVEALTIDELIKLADEPLEEMEEVNEKTMCQLLGEMSDYVNEMLAKWGIDGSYYIDDCEWGDDCFKIKIFDPYGKLDDSFFFRYDKRDEESCYWQALNELSIWLNEWHETLD